MQSPEVMQGQDNTTASNVYSWGIVMWELLTVGGWVGGRAGGREGRQAGGQAGRQAGGWLDETASSELISNYDKGATRI